LQPNRIGVASARPAEKIFRWCAIGVVFSPDANSRMNRFHFFEWDDLLARARSKKIFRGWGPKLFAKFLTGVLFGESGHLDQGDDAEVIFRI
jgi:hypothetical protein